MKEKYNIEEDNIIKSLAVAGIIGNLVKTNASISGAECGCQAEVGTAT
jgi:L-serine dehydratase